MDVGQVALDLPEVDSGHGHDPGQISLMTHLVAVKVHEDEMLETCDRGAHAEDARGGRGGHDRALGLPRCDQQADLS